MASDENAQPARRITRYSHSTPRKEENPEPIMRTTRSSFSIANSNGTAEATPSVDPKPPTNRDLLYGEPISLDDILSQFPARHSQIFELLQLLGPLDSPMLPLFLYGGPSTGKTNIILHIFRLLNRPFVYSSCLSCYSPRILFESVLNQLLFHRRNAGNGYSSAKRCEKASDFINYLREGLVSVSSFCKNSEKSSSNDLGGLHTRKMFYLVFDNLEQVRNWDKSSSMLSLLFNLYDILKLPEVGIIFISSASQDAYYSSTGYTEPISVLFPDYTEDDFHQIFMRGQQNPKLYRSFLDVVLKPSCRVSRRLDELAPVFASLFKKYCEPLSEVETAPSGDTKRRLLSHLQPHIIPSLNEILRVAPGSGLDVEANKGSTEWQGGARKLGGCRAVDEIHMSVSAKYLLISAFLSSRNPATLDASLFDSTGGSDNRKRRRSSAATIERKDGADQEMAVKGPGSFPLERLLAIFQCVASVTYCPSEEEEEQGREGMGAEGDNSGLMSDVLLQLSSLCAANLISRSGSCPLEGSTRYRCTASEDMALLVARSLEFPLAKYLYRR